MNTINCILQIIVNAGLILGALFSIYKRLVLKIEIQAIRDFAKFADMQSSKISTYDLHQKAKRNALNKIILSGLSFDVTNDVTCKGQ